MPPKRFERSRPLRERRKVFVIATEGKETEPIYFHYFNSDEFRKNIHVKVLGTRTGGSSPRAVAKRLREYVKEYDVEPGDELWVVVDVDSWGAQTLDQLCQECGDQGYRVAVSNPCFELWLLLHQDKPRTPASARDCQRELERHLGSFTKSKYDLNRLIPYIQAALNHARRLDQNPDELWPHTTGTHVYRLVEKLVE